MRAHGIADLTERQRSFSEHRKEIEGRIPSGPFEFSADLTFDDVKPVAEDPPVVRRFKLAIRRDARYAAASGPYLRLHGLSQNLRSIYDGSAQLQDGGGT